MDCQAPVLGHSALRCAGLSRSQLRLQMLPATLYLLGLLIVLVFWIKLALARRIFYFRQVFTLALCGGLDFCLAVITLRHPQDQASPSIGGLAALVCLFLLLSIYQFLPPHLSLPGIIDRLLAAFFTSSVLLNVLASIHVPSPTPSSLTDAHNVVYAEAACLVCFYLSSITASQFPRFFTLVIDPDRGSSPPTATTMSPFATATYLTSLLAFLCQAGIAFSLPSSFSLVMTSSMASAFGYLLLVSTFVLLNRASADPAAESVEDTVADRRPERGVDAGASSANEEAHDPVVKSSSQVAVNSIQGHSYQRSRSASNVVASERGSVVWIGSPRQPTTPQNAANRARQSSRIPSGLSHSSWARVEQLMRWGTAASTDGRARPASGVTYYGSESSYREGTQTRRSSMLSCLAIAAGGYGYGSNTVAPSVPAIDPRYIHSTFEMDLGFAKPLAKGDEPIALSEGCQSSADLTNPPRSGLKGAFNSLTQLFSKDRVQWHKDALKETQSMTTLVQTRSQEGAGHLPARYQSSKLFPATDWDSTVSSPVKSPVSAGPQSPQDSEVKHTEWEELDELCNATKSLGRSTLPESEERQREAESAPLSSNPPLADTPLAAPQSPAICGRSTKVIRRTSIAEDKTTNLATSIMFPKYLQS